MPCAVFFRVLVVVAFVLARADVFAQPSNFTPADRQRVERVMSQMLARHDAAVLLRASDGRILAAFHRPVLARRIATPGSTVKPFVLERLLSRGVVTPTQSLICDSHLNIGGRDMSCAHPRQFARFSAVEALAFSCNTYFAKLGGRLPVGDLESLYREIGFAQTTRLLVEESNGRVQDAGNADEREMLAIGAAGVWVTPLELAAAYRRLALIDARGMTPQQRIVREGLRAAVARGMASAAAVKGLDVAGKTGTACDRAGGATHAWFAGFAPADHAEVVLVVFVEGGSGAGDAAPAAKKILAAWRGAQ